MPTTVTLTLPRPHAGQERVRREMRRFNVLACGRRWGKTTFGTCERLVPPALEGYPVAWFSPTYKMLSEVWRETTALLRPVVSRVNVQEHRLELVTGGVIDMWSLDTPDVARGRKYRRIGVDEAAMVRDLMSAWQQVIRPTLADYEGEADFYSTPKGFNDFHELFKLAETSDQWAAWQMPTAENPHIKASEIEAMRAELPGYVFEQEVLARFVSLDGALFKREWFKVVEKAPDGLFWARYWDLAASTKTSADYTASAAVAHNVEDGTLYIRDMIRGRWEWPDARKVIMQTMHAEPDTLHAIEEAMHGLAAIQEIRREPSVAGVALRGIRVDKDKLTRALPWAARAEGGKVALVRGAWVSAFLDEACQFDGLGTSHDDQVDTVSGGVELVKRGSNSAVGAFG
jgi:predicted phage terminase large subunit-like protein